MCEGDENQTCAGSEDKDIYEELSVLFAMGVMAGGLAAELPWESAELFIEVWKKLQDFAVAHSSYITYV